VTRTLRCVCGAILTAGSAEDLFRRVEEHIERAHDPARRTLTRMETQIAALVYEGRTNPEIGEELGVGVKTVESHLSRVFRKLGISSREELRIA
jgi:DNA-binding NarL/FixJ family response regulator